MAEIPTIPFLPYVAVYLAGMFWPMTVMRHRHVNWPSITRWHIRWTCWTGPAGLYICLWNAYAGAGWVAVAILGPLVFLGVWMAVLLLRMDRMLHG